MLQHYRRTDSPVGVVNRARPVRRVEGGLRKPGGEGGRRHEPRLNTLTAWDGYIPEIGRDGPGSQYWVSTYATLQRAVVCQTEGATDCVIQSLRRGGHEWETQGI